MLITSLSPQEHEMLKTAVHQTVLAWSAQRESPGLPFKVIESQGKSWRDLAMKLENCDFIQIGVENPGDE